MAGPYDPSNQPSPGASEPSGGQFGQYGQYGQYGQPAQPSWGGAPPAGQPGQSGAYWQPGAPSQSLYGQPGQSGAYGQPSQSGAYGQPGAPSQAAYGQPGAPSQGFYGQPGMASQAFQPPMPAKPKKSRRGLWIGLGIAAVLLLATGGGAGFAAVQYFAPAVATGELCAALKTQNYTAGYGLLSSGLQGQFTQDQYTQASTALDKIEGTVTNCATSQGSNSYTYSLGSDTAAIQAVITRSTAGSMQGTLKLKNEHGTWKIDGLDTGLLGVNMGALLATGAYCQALQSQNYTAAYGMLGSAVTGTLTQAVFVSQAKLHDQLDGTVSACDLVGLGTGNSDTNASLTASIARTKLGQKQGQLSLDVEGGAWKISTIGTSLQGTDLGALLVTQEFCKDLHSANYADLLHNVFSDAYKGNASVADVQALFGGAVDDIKWAGCTPIISSYTVSGTSASIQVTLIVVQVSTGQTDSGPILVKLVQQSSGWKVDNFAKAS